MSQQQPLLDVDPAARRDEDFYRTPAWMTQALLRRLTFGRGWRLFEPCVGDGAIVRAFPDSCDFGTNDIVARPPVLPDFLLDARHDSSWQHFERAHPIDVAITNPPFNDAFEIARAGFDHVTVALILLLRLSWLEPTEDRGPWLKRNPPTRVIVLPRHDFRGNGKTDSVTSCWCLWSKGQPLGKAGIDVVTRAERDELLAQIAREENSH